MDLRLYNTLTRNKETFEPIDANNVRMYVCGPTVYDFAHIGNARPAIVFDVLYRLLRHVYGKKHVTYVRNITDVDDKINARALRDFPDLPLNEAIRNVTEKTADQYHKDVEALGCLPPTIEPRATEFVLPRTDGKSDMATLIQNLLDKNHAYIATGSEGREVLFDVTSMDSYGALSNRKLEDQQAGARIEAKDHKKNAGDFVLWKESSANEPGWDAVFNGETIHGRPGWHIECSAMSDAYLGKTFDIHGGGLDLIFPHHENEIAQSCCAHGTQKMANYWMHNGYLQVEGKKMSKSVGNFVTIHDLLHTEKFGGRKWSGEVLRLAMLMTHYREPIDFSIKRLEEAERLLNKLRSFAASRIDRRLDKELWDRFIIQVGDDLNTPMALRVLGTAIESPSPKSAYTIFSIIKLLGFTGKRTKLAINAEKMTKAIKAMESLSENDFRELVESAFRHPFFPSGKKKPESQILDEIYKFSILSNKLSGELQEWANRSAELRYYNFDFAENETSAYYKHLIDKRLKFLNDKNFAEADRIRDELLSQGIQLKDSKDSVSGERVTTWEIKR